MKQKLFSMLVLLAAVVSGAMAADGIECSASDIGKVICTDGSIYAKVSDVPTGKTAAAMIAYIDMENKNGLALALSDEGSMTWSEANSACAGKSAVAGGTWVLPSKEQWEAMGAKESNSTSATALRDGFSSVGGTNMQSGAYWSSTENSTNVNKAWRYNFTTGFYWDGSVDKTVNNYVRACLTFNILVAPPTYSVTLAEGTEDAGNWKAKVGDGQFQTLPTEAVEGSPVTATYSGDRKVKSVKAVKKAASLIVNPVVGQIIGSDGKNYDANATLPTGVTAVAKIAYVGNDAETSTTYNHGLALALEDVPGTTINWCSQTDATCLGTGHQFDSEAGAKGDMAGIANTDALVNNTGHTHAAASAARNYNSGTHPAGTSAWFLPSAGQWNKMFNAAGGYENLKNNASLQNDDENYWSSTEYNAGGAWDFYSDGGSWYHNSKSNSYDRVRPCLAF